MASSDGYESIPMDDDTSQPRRSFLSKFARHETIALLPTLLNRSSVNLDEDFYRDICRKLEDCATDQSGLDIYQIAGFYKFYSPPSGSYLRYYLPSAFKAMLCCCIQTAGMIAFMYNVLMTMPKSIAECNLDEEWDLKLLATLLSLYIAAHMSTIIRERRTEGLYENISFAPPFIGTEWLYLGLYSNMFALVCSIYGSFLVVYTSQDAISMVLNSMSLYFIMELDTMMVDRSDFARVKNYMKHDFVFEDCFDEDWYDETSGDIQFSTILGMRVQTSGRKGWSKCGTCVTVTGGMLMVGAVIAGMIGAMAMPIAIAVCY